jgi:CheY-like chemotaxis protein
MAASVILAVDDDEWILRAIQVALQKRAYEILTAADGWDALSVVLKKTPDVVITDVVMPRMDGWALVKQLRSKAQFALVPVIFLTSQSSADDRVRGYRLGADDYLAKPLDLRTLDERVARALEKRRELEAGLQPATGGAHPAGTLQGTVDQIGLASLLSVLELGRRSGILRMVRPSGAEEGLIYLVDGAIRRAELTASPKSRNLEAVCDLLRWADGRFEFTPMSLRVADEIAMPTTSLLLEGARRIDEAKR